MDSNDVRREWEERSGAYSPDYYAYYGPDETSESLRAVLDDAVDSDASILELGCSSGRHLAHLLDHGYSDLHGVDINDEAFEVMADNYPDLASRGTFQVDAIESFLPSVEDDRFDVVYSVETLQHIHPDDSHVFADVARVAADLLVTVENEGSGDESQEESGDERTGGDVEGGSEERTGETAGSDADRGVNYVHDEFPLYYRDWEAVFTDLGFVQTASRATDRDTMRVFRSER